jgi:hypothetical protein
MKALKQIVSFFKSNWIIFTVFTTLGGAIYAYGISTEKQRVRDFNIDYTLNMVLDTLSCTRNDIRSIKNDLRTVRREVESLDKGQTAIVNSVVDYWRVHKDYQNIIDLQNELLREVKKKLTATR